MVHGVCYVTYTEYGMPDTDPSRVWQYGGECTRRVHVHVSHVWSWQEMATLRGDHLKRASFLLSSALVGVLAEWAPLQERTGQHTNT